MARFRSKIEPRFWENKALSELSPDEWEAVCDRCGLCCLEKLEDPEKGEIYITSITCHFFELSKCHCLIYDHRHDLYSGCIELTPQNLRQLHWLPETCAYRLLAEGKDLPAWHHLVCGDPQAVHEAVGEEGHGIEVAAILHETQDQVVNHEIREGYLQHRAQAVHRP